MVRNYSDYVNIYVLTICLTKINLFDLVMTGKMIQFALEYCNLEINRAKNRY